MPPKAARGRGRGRGGASAAGRAPPPAVVADENGPPTEINSPNSSPADIPTETPAPTPVRAPPQRAVAGPALKPGAKPAAAPSKFKPKAIRRGAAERDELARLDTEKKERLRKEAEAAKARAERGTFGGRGRGDRGRGRGDTMGRRFVAGRSNEQGMFSVLPAALEHTKRPMELENVPGSTNYGSSGPSASSDFFKVEHGARGKSGGGGGGGGGGGSGGAYGGGNYNKGKSFVPQYPDHEQDDSPRVDIEDINKKYESDDDVMITSVRRFDRKGKSPAPSGLKPVRLHRVEHKERTTIVNTAPEEIEIKKSESEDEDSDIQMIDEKPSSGLLMNEPIGMHIKNEPVEEVSIPASPDSKRKAKVKAPDSPTLDRKKKKVITKHKEEKPVLQTEEDRAEYARHLVDVQVLAEELGGMQTRSHAPDGDVAMAGAEPEAADKKEGRLYLFQFPGVLTKLYNPKTKAKTKEAEKEKENEADHDVEMLSSNSKPDSSKRPSIKVEEGVEIIKDENPTTSTTSDEIVDEVGAVGKMVVRKSGRVEIQWGSTELLVQRGTDTGFLGAGYVIDDVELPPGVDRPGTSTSMGMVMGKFVVVPDFADTW